MNVWLQLAKMRAGQAVAQAGADLAEDAKKDPEWLELGNTQRKSEFDKANR